MKWQFTTDDARIKLNKLYPLVASLRCDRLLVVCQPSNEGYNSVRSSAIYRTSGTGDHEWFPYYKPSITLGVTDY